MYIDYTWCISYLMLVDCIYSIECIIYRGVRQELPPQPVSGNLKASGFIRIRKPGESCDRCHTFDPNGFHQDLPDRRNCDRGHTFEPSDALKRRICDRSHTFEPSIEEPNLRQGSHF